MNCYNKYRKGGGMTLLITAHGFYIDGRRTTLSLDEAINYVLNTNNHS